MRKLFKEWWFWLTVITIICFFIGLIIVKNKVDKEVNEIDTNSNTYNNKTLIMNEEKEKLFLEQYENIYNINTNIFNVLKEYSFKDYSTEKIKNEIIIRTYSEPEDITLQIKYNINTNNLTQIIMTDLDNEKLDTFSTNNLIIMELLELDTFNIQEDILGNIWNNIKNNTADYDVETENWTIKNRPELKMFLIERK